MIEIGRICIKIAGRDAGRECVIVDVLDNNYVLIDGNVRRRKCNVAHIEPTAQKIEIVKDAAHNVVKAEFEKLKIAVWETKPKEQKEKPKKQRKQKEKPAGKEKKADKKAKASEKKDTKKKEAKPKAAPKKESPKTDSKK